MGGSKEYTVTVKAKETVAAALPRQDHWLQLSNLDLLLPPLDVGVFFCYKKQPAGKQSLSFAAMVATLKASLAQALVTYYPFAGEAVTNSTGEPELLCNNRGVDFIQAYADVELAELYLYDPGESVEGKLLPKKKEGVLSVQATELKCGGLVLACTFDHRIADAYSANMFFAAWAATSRCLPLPLAPSFRRSLLSPHRLGCHLRYPTSDLDRLFGLVSSLPPLALRSQPFINRLYFIPSADVDRMQAAAGPKRTKVEAFTAYLCCALAKASGPNEKVCRMGVVVDGRTRLGPDMTRYFGNVLSIPFGTLDVEQLRQMELSEVAEEVHMWLRAVATAEHFRGLVDWVEAQRPEAAAARIYVGGEEGGERGPGCVVSSGRGFPVAEVEFGWGQPVFGSYYFPWGGESGYVMPMPSARGGGDWVVYVHLRKDLVEALEKDEPPLLLPLTAEYFLGPVGPAANGDALSPQTATIANANHPPPTTTANGEAQLQPAATANGKGHTPPVATTASVVAVV